MGGNYKAPIVHGVGYAGDIPTKCQQCIHKKQEGNRYICENHKEGKFVGTIGYSCFKHR